MLFSVSKENNLTYFSLRSLGMIIPKWWGLGWGKGWRKIRSESVGSVKIQFFTRYIFFASLAISNLNIPIFFLVVRILSCVFPVQICI